MFEGNFFQNFSPITEEALSPMRKEKKKKKRGGGGGGVKEERGRREMKNFICKKDFKM